MAEPSQGLMEEVTKDKSPDQKEKEYSEIVLQLRIVSLIQPSDKLRTTQQGNCSIETVKGALQGLARYFSNERRADNVGYLILLIKRAFDFYERLLGDECKRSAQMRSRVRSTLLGCKDGLKNLSHTYMGDVEISTHIKMLSESIDDWKERVSNGTTN
jgi:hypothetical protein